MQTKLPDTGERMVPELHKGRNMYGAHIGRYEFGASLLSGKIVLDIACGSGYGTKIISKKAKKVFGVDIDEDTIKYAKENYSSNNIEYIVGDGKAIPLMDNSVDVIVSYETIEHIEDYKSFMKEVKRVLKNDGLLLLSTPNDVEYGEGNHYHFYEFNYRELSDLVKKFFKHQNHYFQTLWYYSSIVSEDMHKNEWRQKIDTISTIPLEPEQCIYFFVVCSDKPITTNLDSVGVIGEHYRHRDMQAMGERHRKVRASLDESNILVKAKNEKIRDLENQLQVEIAYKERLQKTLAWKMLKKAQKVKRSLKSQKNK